MHDDHTLTSSSIMPKGVVFSEAVCLTVICMAVCNKSPNVICAFTDISKSTQHLILKHWQETGTVKRSTNPQLAGRPRQLKVHEVSVLQLLFYHSVSL